MKRLQKRINERCDELQAEMGLKKPTDEEAREFLVQSNLDTMKMERTKRLAAEEAERRFKELYPAE